MHMLVSMLGQCSKVLTERSRNIRTSLPAQLAANAVLRTPSPRPQVATICGPYEFADPQSTAPPPDNLFCIQSFVVPQKDMRYISAYDVQEGPLCTVLARRFSARYTHAFDDPGSLIPEPVSGPTP